MTTGKTKKIAFILIGIIALPLLAFVGLWLYVSSLDMNIYKDNIVQHIKEETGRDIIIDGDLDIQLSLTPSIRVNKVRMANASWGSHPYMLEIQEFEAKVNIIPLLNEKIDIDYIILRGANILIEKNKDGILNIDFSKKAMTAKSADEKDAPSHDQDNDATNNEKTMTNINKAAPDTSIPIIKQAVIENATLRYIDHQKESQNDMQTHIENLNLSTNEKLSNILLSLNMQHNKIPIEATATLDSSSSFLSRHGIYSISMQGKLDDINLTLKGKIDAKKGGRHDANIAGTLKGAAMDIKIDASMDDDKIVNITGDFIDLDETEVMIKKLSSLRGGDNAVLNTQPEKSSKTTVISANDAPDQNQAKKATNFKDKVILPIYFSHHEIQINGDVKRLVFKKMDLGHLKTTILLNKDEAKIQPFSIQNGNALIKGGAHIDNKDATLSASLSNITPDILKNFLPKSDALSGHFNGDITFKSSGKNIRELTKNLNGTVNIESEDITVIPNDILKSKEISKILGARLQGCFVSNMTIRDGNGTINKMVLISDVGSVKGDGKINLVNETIDMGMETDLSINGVLSANIALKIQGPLQNPTIIPDKNKKASAVIKNSNLLGGLLGGLLKGATGDNNANKVILADCKN